MQKYFILLFTFFCLKTSAQDKKRLDSLYNVITSHSQDTTTVNALNELGIEYESVSDSASLYYYKKAAMLAKKILFYSGEAEAFQNIGIAYYNMNEADSSLLYYKKALEIFTKENNLRGIAVCNSNLGITYRMLGNLSEAVNCFITALKYSEKINYLMLSGNSKLSIGNIYRQKHNLNLAEKYYSEAMKDYQKSEEPSAIAMALNNLGLVCSDKKQHEKALDYYFKALKLRDSLGLRKAAASTYDNIACEYNDLDDFKKALDFHEKALTIQKQINDRKGIATSLINIAAVYTKQKKYTLATENLLQAMIMAREMKFRDMLKEIYLSLSENYAFANEYKPSLDFHRRYSDLKDSILNEDESNQIAQLQTEYDTEKKDSEIKLLSKEKEVKEIELKKKSIIIKSVFAGLLLVILLAFYIYRSYREKKKANEMITEQKEKVEKQKDIIEEKQKEITDSIHYAKRIQKALLASDSFLEKHLPEYFVLYKPKDIVSGDFYWATETPLNEILIMTGDCTGHGVPGAFMSLLGVNFLNEIIADKKIIRPDLIFNQLRKDIIHALNPEDTDTEGNDGMDAVLCSFNFNANVLQFAAANNPLWIIRNKEMMKFNADKMPIGRYFEEQKDFGFQTVQLEKGDTVFAFTDGYADQFGGEKGKKFKYKSLEKLLLSINHLSMDEQRDKLDKVIEEWKGNLEQVDDILIIGIRV
jgi:serine phosphatase RsbU (regulator of sigma subunit)